jgi:hypothetical protein
LNSFPTDFRPVLPTVRGNVDYERIQAGLLRTVLGQPLATGKLNQHWRYPILGSAIILPLVNALRARLKSQLKPGEARRRSTTRVSAMAIQPAALHSVFS